MKKGKDTEIWLTVDTSRINESNKENSVLFSDDRSDPSDNPGDPKKFISVVDRNHKVVWKGKPADDLSAETIDILEVTRKRNGGGAEILESISKSREKNGVVIGKVKDKDITGMEAYDVKFQINGDTIFTVDPKLRMSVPT